MLREFHASKRIHAGLMPEHPTADIPEWVRDLRMALLTEEVRELYDAAMRGDIVKIADGIADVVYVAVGTAVAYGIPFDAVFREVHRSNMTKVNTPDEAKLVKGPDYEPPDIAGVLGLLGDHFAVFTKTSFAVEHPLTCQQTLEHPCEVQAAIRRIVGRGGPIGGRWQVTAIDSSGLPELERADLPAVKS
ncbi:MAG: hypothetical protein J2P30_01635 [Actinobacteria bacterium]|nr:hypothetical protein [Actinomycetota bacterium]